jgi:hypothetical protein
VSTRNAESRCDCCGVRIYLDDGGTLPLLTLHARTDYKRRQGVTECTKTQITLTHLRGIGRTGPLSSSLASASGIDGSWEASTSMRGDCTRCVHAYTRAHVRQHKFTQHQHTRTVGGGGRAVGTIGGGLCACRDCIQSSQHITHTRMHNILTASRVGGSGRTGASARVMMSESVSV